MMCNCLDSAEGRTLSKTTEISTDRERTLQQSSAFLNVLNILSNWTQTTPVWIIRFCTLKSSHGARLVSHFPDACIQTRQLKQSQRASELSADQTEATVLTVNTHTVCLLSKRDDGRITYTHTPTHTHL